jgi:hypothetical protein
VENDRLGPGPHFVSREDVVRHARLEARGFLAGIGKTILIVIIIVVVIGTLIRFSAARRFGPRR